MTERLEAYVAALRGLDSRWMGDLFPTGDRVNYRRRDPERVSRLLGELVNDPVDELIDLWRWHNGQDPRTQQALFCGFIFRRLTIEDVKTFRDFASLAWGAAPRGSAWPDVDEAVPVAWGSEGEVVFVDSGAGAGRGAVFLSDDRRSGPPQRLASSVEEVVDMAYAALVSGRWRLGDDLVLRDAQDPAATQPTTATGGSALTVHLEIYVALLRQQQPHWTADLRPGLPRGDVIDELQRFVADPVGDLVALWAWHDGQDPMRTPLFCGFNFPPMSGALIERFREHAAETHYLAVEEGLFWPEVADLVPVLYHVAGGEWIFVDSGYGPGRGHVYTDGGPHDMVPAIRLGRSLAEVVAMAEAAIAAGWWRLTPDLNITDTRDRV